MTRRVFSREFKREAVHLLTQRGVSVAQAARDLDLHATVLSRWIREFGDSPAGAFPGKSQMKPEDEEVRRLRREVVKLKAERDILKKAYAGQTVPRTVC
jgi:transposase